MASETEVALKIEIMLQINERLYLTGLIGQTLYEQARIKIQKMSGVNSPAYFFGRRTTGGERP